MFALAATTLLAGTVTAVQEAEVVSVTRDAPADAAPNAEFDIKLTISGELPLVAGIVETIPAGFSFVSTTHPTEQYSVSGQKIAFATINATEIKYTVKAPSSGAGSFTGEWIDVLSEKEGVIADTTVIIGDGDTIEEEEKEEEEEEEEEEVTVTPTPTPTSAVPGFEAVFAIVALLIVYTLDLKRKGGDKE